MDPGYLFVAMVGRSLGNTLLTFPFAALAVQSRRKAKLAWRDGLAFFGMSLVIVCILNLFLFLAAPSLLTSSDFTLSDLLLLGIPLVVSAAVLLLLWKPTPRVD